MSFFIKLPLMRIPTVFYFFAFKSCPCKLACSQISLSWTGLDEPCLRTSRRCSVPQIRFPHKRWSTRCSLELFTAFSSGNEIQKLPGLLKVLDHTAQETSPLSLSESKTPSSSSFCCISPPFLYIETQQEDRSNSFSRAPPGGSGGEKFTPVRLLRWSLGSYRSLVWLRVEF